MSLSRDKEAALLKKRMMYNSVSANRRIFHSPLIANSANAFTPRPLTRNLKLRTLGVAARLGLLVCAGLCGARFGGFAWRLILHSLYGCEFTMACGG